MIPLFFTPYPNRVGPLGRRRRYQLPLEPVPDLRRPDDDELVAAIL